ncbi:MAG: efflux RND transporter periplasmic adaptor subunit [Caldimicrobium sp.]|nr:efflux RND transporter periplasmic adaptor subunit [Caldimicrobium sp.]MCX7613287.1 efflux RND transporter periplasmic adaptor subunit [Caldimicrobium sp.]MDW8182395.1 efflux RND transporter periplasmic adaptor subunit [Caldimicrobium sp.]
MTLFKIKSPQEIVYELEYPGKTKSAAEIKVVARVSGILREVYFKEGSYVNKGVLLGVVEREPYKISYDQAKAQLEKAQVELQRAEKDWVRVSNAFRDRLVSEAERDKALYDFEMAKAKVKEAQSNLSQAELNLRYTEIRAEIEGILGKKFIDAGNLVSPGTPITSIIQIKPLEIEFSIPERDLAQLGVKENPRKLMHKRVELHIDNFGAPESATIFFVDSKFDETSSLKVKALYPNKGARLLPEMFLRVKVRGIPQRAILVPQKMVLDSPRGTYVFIVEGNKTKIRPIKIVASYKDYYVVESGVRTDDLIVADNLVRLRPDMPVKIEKIIEETP